MKLSHGTRIIKAKETNGYGYATNRMINSLTRLGHTVEKNDPTADAEIWFDQPHHWNFSEGAYKIGYHPWESTLLKKGWVEIMNKCDEVWTPSPIVAEWYEAAGIHVPIFVYEHGVDKIWTPRKRKVEDKFKFLHIGAEAARKGGNETMRALHVAFPKRDDVELNMKMVADGWNITNIGRTNIINKILTVPELVELYHDCHAFVYPSYGEGFGLTPLQAISTGMPTITVPAWAPYERFLDPRLNISSTLQWSKWRRDHHPGKMFFPKFDDIVDRMRWVVDNYDDSQATALDKTEQIQSEYNWDTLTKDAFDKLAGRL